MSKNYMDKAKIDQSFIDWHEALKIAELEGKPEPQIPNDIAIAMMNVAKNVARGASYRNYSCREDMEAKAIMNMVIKAKKYDTQRENANSFAYFSLITINTFKEYIPTEKREYMAARRYKHETQPIETLTNGDMSFSAQSTVFAPVHNNALTNELYQEEIASLAEYDRNEEAKKKKRKARLAELTEIREALALEQGILPEINVKKIL